MKLPKVKKRLCKTCKTHTEHKVINQGFKGLNKNHTQSRGSQTRVKKRGLRRGTGNLGRFSRKPVGKWKMTGRKNTKKSDFRYTCQTCKKTSVQPSGIRAKRFELT